MSRDPGIICFKHCNSSSIFCKNIPNKCPICSAELSSFVLEPFRIPYPCSDAAQNSCSIAIRPSQGNFLDTYTKADDLHIAIVNSEGNIFEFDNCGLVVNNFSTWNNCLTLNAVPESWHSHWDSVLSTLCQNPKWNSYNYNESSMNCFSFVINFFQLLNYPDLHFLDKEEFCRLFILPKIQETLRYISLYRNLKNKNYFVA